MENIEIKIAEVVTAPYSVPATIDEAVALAPTRPDGDSPVLDAMVNYILFHKVYSYARKRLVDWVEKNTAVKRYRHSEKDDKGADVVVIDEKDVPFINRVMAEGVADAATLSEALADICAADDAAFAKFLNAERRAAAPKKLSKEIELQVAATIAAGKGDALADRLSAALGRTVTADPLDLGTALRDHKKRIVDEAAARAKAELGL